MIKLIQNAVFVPELDKYFLSRHTHDYVSITLNDGRELAIDGGPSYQRMDGDISLITEKRIIDYSLSLNSSAKDIVDKLLWGSRGKDGTSPLTYRPIRLLDKDHIASILELDYISQLARNVCTFWLNTHDVQATGETVNKPTLTE